MAKCPKPGCDCTEFKIEKIQVEGYKPPMPVIVCRECGTLISLAPNNIELLLRDMKSNLK
jgi:hypothetical protein